MRWVSKNPFKATSRGLQGTGLCSSFWKPERGSGRAAARQRQAAGHMFPGAGMGEAAIGVGERDGPRAAGVWPAGRTGGRPGTGCGARGRGGASGGAARVRGSAAGRQPAPPLHGPGRAGAGRAGAAHVGCGARCRPGGRAGGRVAGPDLRRSADELRGPRGRMAAPGGRGAAGPPIRLPPPVSGPHCRG